LEAEIWWLHAVRDWIRAVKKGESAAHARSDQPSAISGQLEPKQGFWLIVES
jgi:hypothetical protein